MNKKIIVSDAQLWQEFKDGNESSFALIYEQNVAILYNYGLKLIYNKELIKDSIQDLFVEIWNSKERLGDAKSITAYLCKSLRRKLLSQTSKNRKMFDTDSDIDFFMEKTTSIEHSLIEKQHLEEQRKALQKAIIMLTDKQKEIIHLKFYAKLSYDEISGIMNLDKKGVYNLMTRTINKLKLHFVFTTVLLIVIMVFSFK